MPQSDNPYVPPKSDIRSGASRPIGWKIYACAVAAVQLLGFIVDLHKVNLVELLDDGITAVAMVGLIGYAFRRRFLRRRFWMAWAILFPLSNAAVGMWIYPRQNTGTRMGYFAAMLLFLPQYWAVLRYAYRSRESWQG